MSVLKEMKTRIIIRDWMYSCVNLELLLRTDKQQAYHPTEGTTLSLFTRNECRFLPAWYDKFP